ncbi:helix-turn-helix domain-containing protein [Novosphingobium acidiphilum]|uniref:helix-turn-helix domain-containing protein n=1 Tax=Novosphingobium acidiphilum TaxID=505248 RepID=UPI0012EB99BB|nr:helix-turn-helix transcriptional regulator [Novosphingobium acidiphilum]
MLQEPIASVDKVKFAATRAAGMLREAIPQQTMSLRSIAKKLNYKQATVLSQMAKGRIQIPLERATEIARVMGIDPGEFLLAAIEQRTEDAHLINNSDFSDGRKGGFQMNLMMIAGIESGRGLDDLTEVQKRIIREVVAEAQPERRWLSVAELPAMIHLRRLRPRIAHQGLNDHDMAAIKDALG